MDYSWIPLLLQGVDPLFPVGSYAHSYALEELANLGVVSDEKSLREFLERETLPMLQHFELPLLRAMAGAVAGGAIDQLCELDEDCHLMKLPRELREAGVAQGRRRLAMLAKLFAVPLLAQLQQALADGRFRAQHLSVFAVHGHVAAVPVHALLHAWLYLSLAGPVTAAPKLIRIGEEGCQRVLSSCLSKAQNVVAESLATPASSAGWTSPLLDLASARHEHSLVRLFIS